MKRPCICIAAGFALGEALCFAISEKNPSMAVFACIAAFILCSAAMLGTIAAGTDKRRVPVILGLAFLSGFLRLGLNDLTLREYDSLNALCTGTEGAYDTEITDITVKGNRLVLRCGELIVYYTPSWDKTSRLYDPDSNYYSSAAYDTSSSADSENSGDELESLFSVGNRIRIIGEFSIMDKPRNPGEFNYYLYYLADGVTHKCFADSIEITDPQVNIFKDTGFRIRRCLLKRIGVIYNDTDAGIIKAVLLGDKSDLDDDINDLYRKNGIAHLLAISGLHVGIIGVSLYNLLRKKLKLSYWVCGIFCGAWIIFYCLLTGSGVSTMRATSMLLIMFLAGALGMHYDMLSSAGLAALIILIIHPYQLFNCAFLLSFTCIIAIAGPADFIIKQLHLKNSLLKSLVLSLTIQLFTLPVTAYFFFEVSLYGCLLNLIVIPLMTFVVWSSLIATLISFIWPVGAMLTAYISHYILTFYTWLGSIAIKLPCSSILIGRPALWQIFVYYFLFLFVLYSYRLKALIPGLHSWMSDRGTAFSSVQEEKIS